MKAGVVLALIVGVAVALWVGANRGPDQSGILITKATATPMADIMVVGAATIENRGAPDWLIAATSPEAEVVLRDPEMQGRLPVQTGTSLLASDGAHLHIAPDPSRENGAMIPVTLTFEQAGDVAIRLRYTEPDTQDDPHAGHMMAAAHAPLGDEPAPTVTIAAKPDGDGWILDVETNNFTFREDLADGDHVPGTGHGHIYNWGMKLGRLYGDTYRIGPLPQGRHKIRVALNTNDHRAYVVNGMPVEALTIITVD